MPQYAVITGASSGIGAELSRILARRGYGLILVARREDRLKTLAAEVSSTAPGASIEIVTADLSKVEECERLVGVLQNFDIGVFVNNAGFGDCGNFAESDLQKELQMINVNVRALHILSKFAVQHMKAGYLLNVGSCAGLIAGGPYMAAYYATKAYVVSFSQALACEARELGSKLSVSVLCPGPVDTEFNDVANVRFALRGMSVKRCAAYAVKQMFKKQTVIIPGFLLRVGMVVGRLLPRTIFVKVAGMQQKKKLYR